MVIHETGCISRPGPIRTATSRWTPYHFFLEHPPTNGGGGCFFRKVALFSGPLRDLVHSFTAKPSLSIVIYDFRSSPAPCGWRARFLPPFLFVNMSSATLKSVAKFMSIPCRPATIAIELMLTLMIDDAEPKCVPRGCTIRTKNIGAILCHFTDL
jgi:hypothetical protein